MRLLYSREFEKRAKKLPPKTRKKLAGLLILIARDPFHSQLHTKPLSGMYDGTYSFRITRDWRVIFQLTEAETVYLLTVKHRKDIYR